MELLLLREDYDETSAPVANGRTLTMRLATLGRVYTVGRKGGTVLRERIRPGALKGPLARPGGVLRYRHVGERPGDADSLDAIHGVMTRMWLDGDQVLSDWEVFPGPEGDKLLRIAPSIGGASWSAIVRDARPARDTHGPLTDILRISQVNGASLTPKPAYDDAGVLAVREMQPPPPDAETARRRAQTVADTRAALARSRAMVARGASVPK